MNTLIYKILPFLILLTSSVGYTQVRSYLIKRGSHKSKVVGKVTLPRVTIRGGSMSFSALFRENAKYNLYSNDQADINKLYGFSDCGGSHLKNSARVGWRYYGDRLEAVAFTHVDGDFLVGNQYVLGEIKPGREANFSIRIDGDEYVYKYNDTIVRTPRGCDGKINGYHLKPYFGGNQTAPHDIFIDVSLKGKISNYFAKFTFGNAYPNPVLASNGNTQSIAVTTQDEALEIGLYIYDMLGRKIRVVKPRRVTQESTEIIQYNLNGLASGVYLVAPFAVVGNTEKPGMNANRGLDVKVSKIIYGR